MTRTNDLGGRLDLLHPDELDEQQRDIHTQLEQLTGPESQRDGYVAQLDDRRFIGPFNAMLRTPSLTRALGAWVQAIATAGIAPDVREAVILAVGAEWQAEYELYAHTAAATTVGLSAADIEATLAGRQPRGLADTASLAVELTRSLLRTRSVPDDTYQGCIATFGEDGTIAILSLIGQYQFVSSLLVCFDVPAGPVREAEKDHAPTRPAAQSR